MPQNPDLDLGAVQKTGLWGFNATSGLWKATKVNDAGELVVTTGGGGGGGSSQVDKSAFTEGVTSFTAVGGVFNETPAADPTEDQAAVARITAKRGMHVNLRNASGAELGTATDPVNVEGNVGVTGTVATDPTDDFARQLGIVKVVDAAGVNQLSVNAFGQPGISNDPLHVDGKGTAGAPSGGVVSVQGVVSGTVLPVSGTVSVTEPVSVDDNGSTLSVDDGAGSLTVDQATAANLNATVTPAGASVWDVSDRAARLLGVTSSDFVDRSTFTDGTSRAGVMAGVFNETQTAPTEDQAAAVRITAKRALRVAAEPSPALAADVLTGRAIRLNTVTAVAIITIPAGRTWYGNVSISAIAVGTAAAAKLTADVRTAGTNVTPAVGTQVLELITHHGLTSADFKGITSGDFYVIAPVGNSVTLDLKLDTAATTFEAVATARGVLL